VVSNTVFIVINLDVQFHVQIRVIQLRTDPGRNHLAIKAFRSINSDIRTLCIFSC
jgi:hypothetical protein